METLISLALLIIVCAVIVTPSVILGNYICGKIFKGKKSDE